MDPLEDNIISSYSSSPETSASSAWKPTNTSTIIAVQTMLNDGIMNIRQIVQHLLPPNTYLPSDLDDACLLHLIAQLISEPPIRQKLLQYNTMTDAVELLKRSEKIIVLTGAGVSVSCGIPDFRSRDGIYARLHRDFPDLPNPQAMFDINYFRNNPRPFFDFAREIYPGQFKPSISHLFIKSLEDAGKLLRNYTQNIDTLEQVAGIKNIVQCHGSFATATCCVCKKQVSCDDIKEDIFEKRIPHCSQCPINELRAIMKPDIVFFGEDLQPEFHAQITADKDDADLLIVIGSSLKVRPVALIPSSVSSDVPQILINRESLCGQYTPDIELLGNCDDIICQLAISLGLPFISIVPDNQRIIRQQIDSLCFESIPTDTETLSTNDDEPAIKKCRTEGESSNVDDESDTETVWQPRYIPIRDRIPDASYLFIAPNQSIFPGAELYYDLDSKIYCNTVDGRGRNRSLSSTKTSSSSSSSSSSSISLLSTTLSESALADRYATNDDNDLTPIRCQSCPLFSDT